jgi:hypothetical protein
MAALYIDLKNNRFNYNNVILPLMSHAYDRGILSDYYTLASPNAWVNGTEAYITLREANAVYADNTDPRGDLYFDIERLGKEINAFAAEVRSEELFIDLFDSYKVAHDGIFQEVENSIHKYLNQNYFQSYFTRLNEEISKTKQEIKNLEDEKSTLETSISIRINSAMNMGACTPGDDIGCSRPAPGQIPRVRGTPRASLEAARKRLEEVKASLDIKKPELEKIKKEVQAFNKQSLKERFEGLSQKALETEDNLYRGYLVHAYMLALDEVNQKTLDANEIDINRELIHAYSYFGLSWEYHGDFEVRSILFGKDRIKTRQEILMKLSEYQTTAEDVSNFYVVKKRLEDQINNQRETYLEIIQNDKDDKGFSLVQPTLDRLESFRQEFHPFL